MSTIKKLVMILQFLRQKKQTSTRQKNTTKNKKIEVMNGFRKDLMIKKQKKQDFIYILSFYLMIFNKFEKIKMKEKNNNIFL